jgi:outer membrane receptor protein involved in Fe transport
MLQTLPPSEPPQEVIVVTGRALPEPKAERTAHVDRLDARDLGNSAAHQLDAILLQAPGVQLFRRSDSTSGHPTSQGVTLRALGGNAASRALLVLDGVPQSDPFGGWVSWPAYDAAGLDEVRILRGGGSVTSGPGALAGVIELGSLTDKGFGGALEAGSRESVRGHAFLGERLGGGLLTIDAQGARSDGFVPVTAATRGPVDREAPYKGGSLRARWTLPVGPETELQVAGLGFVDERDRGVAFTGNRTRGGDLSVRAVGRGRWQWSALGYAQWRNFESSFATVNAARTNAARVSLQDDVPGRGTGAGIEVRPPVGRGLDLRLGADARFVSGESRELFGYVAGKPTRRRVSGGRSATAGMFVEGALEHGRVTLTAGGRIDHWRIADGELVERSLGGVPTRDDQYADRSGWEPTARIGVLGDLGAGLSLRAAAYTGWRLPTLNELFRPFRAGPDATAANAVLDPERVTGVEAGVKYRHGPLDLELTAFANRLSDAVANVTLGHGPGSFPGVGFVGGDFRQRQNVEAVRVRGVEASAEMTRGPWLLRLGGSWTHARVAADGEASALDGLRPAQTPNLVLSAALGWDDNGRSVSLHLRHVLTQFEDDLNRLRLPPATTVDAFAAWPVGKQLQLTARLQNVLDEEVVAGETEDGIIERATPRTFWLGFRFLSVERRRTRP